MAPPPLQLIQWLQRNYPKPQIDPEWLQGCYEWVESEFHFDPATQLDDITKHVESQLLQSNLSDSMISGTGLPANLPPIEKTMITGPPILVEIVSITDIGQSAFTLQNVRQARMDRANLAGLAEDADDDEGPIPKYPRGMLRFQLSDGSTILQAFEYRRLPELELGETPLGYKMLIKDIRVRRGLAYLEPKCVVMKGGQSEERNAMQDHDFSRSLRLRLGQPDLQDDAPVPEPEPQPAAPPLAARAPAPAPAPASALVPLRAAPAPTIRSPLRELSEPPSPPVAGPSRPSHEDDQGQPRQRKLPSRAQRSPSPTPPPRNRHETRSHYFASGSGTGSRGKNAEILARERLFSPHRMAPVIVPDSDDDEQPVPSATAVDARAASSDEFDEFDEIYADKDFLDQVDRAERAALASQVPSATLVGTTQVGSAGPSSSSASGSGSGVGAGTSGSTSAVEIQLGSSAVGSTSNTRGSNLIASGATSSHSGRARRAEVDLDVISLEDSDEDDKENVPVPTRHVRRRTAREAIDQDEIIEVSD